MNKLKSVCQDIKEKTAGMSRGEKVSYFFDNYSLELITAAVILIFVIALGGIFLSGFFVKPVLKIGTLFDVENVCGAEVDRLISETFPEDTGRKAPVRISFYTPANETNPEGAMQLAAYLSADEMDCGFVDKWCLEYVVDTGRPLQVSDISETAIGQKMKEDYVNPLYFFYFEDSPRAEAAARLAEAVIR